MHTIQKEKLSITLEEMPEPMNGNLVIEYIAGDVRDYMLSKAGIDSEKSLIELPEEFMNKHQTPIGKGKVLSKAPDAFGQVYRMRFGNETIPAEVNDVIVFPKGAGTAIDPTGKYQFIADKDIMGIYRKSTKES